MSPARLRRRIDRALGPAVALLMAAMVANVLWQVATRFVLGDPSSATEELARFLLVWVGLLGAAYGFGRRVHLAVDLLPAWLPPRTRPLARDAADLCVVAFALLVLCGGGGLLVRLTFALEQTSASLRAPLFLVYLALPLAGAIVVLYAACDLWERRRGEGA